MHGCSIYHYAHPCDHVEVQEALSACAAHESKPKSKQQKPPSDQAGIQGNREFFVRLKCALSATGRNVTVNSTSMYKVPVDRWFFFPLLVLTQIHIYRQLDILEVVFNAAKNKKKMGERGQCGL